MNVNFKRYENDLKRLVETGRNLFYAVQHEIDPTDKMLKQRISEEEIKKLPNFKRSYQTWYSEALACVTQLLPDRRDDFVSYYKLANRKTVDWTNYTLSDYLRGITSLSSDGKWSVPGRAALVAMMQQFTIVESMQDRLTSTLYDIKTLVHADLLDDELTTADELNSKGFHRGAGAIAGVVLEAHLSTVSEVHKKKLPKNATISTLNDTLKKEGIIEIATWRFIQHLGDLRNRCDHKTDKDPTKDQVAELVEGVRKITKSVF